MNDILLAVMIEIEYFCKMNKFSSRKGYNNEERRPMLYVKFICRRYINMCGIINEQMVSFLLVSQAFKSFIYLFILCRTLYVSILYNCIKYARPSPPSILEDIGTIVCTL